MNIKFGTDNFYVRYLKRFLNHELHRTNTILGEFDKEDLQSLITYLNLPNVEDMFVVQEQIQQKFPILQESFNVTLKDNYIIWTCKTISNEISTYLTENIKAIQQYCDSVGWEFDDMQEWVDLSKDINNDGIIDNRDRQILNNVIYSQDTDYNKDIIKRCDLNLDGVVNSDDLVILDNYIQTGKLTLSIKKSDRTNYFPNKDMLVFVNQFDGTFLYGYTLRDDPGITDGVDDTVHENKSRLYKIALYQCQPGQKITIAHNNNKTTRLVIGSCSMRLKQDIIGNMLQNVVDVQLKPGEGYQYTTTSTADGTGSDARWVCIQCPSDYSNLNGTGTTTITIETGDINFDGKIDMEDYHLLANYTATGPGSEELHWTPTAKQLAVMNVDETHSGIDVYDAVKLYKFIQGDPDIPTLGVTYYTYNSGEELALDNVSNLLIIDGHYDRDVNIPFMDFVTDGWVIHEKFFNYLFGIAIHKYSNSEDITYLQKLLQVYYPDYIYSAQPFYPGYYNEEMKQIVKRYQTSKVSYTTGDLNMDNRLTFADLQSLRNYLDDSNVINSKIVQQYLNNEIELTEAEIAELDVTNDGRITYADYEEYIKRINNTYESIFQTRADINGDNIIDETDYIMLQRELEGLTNNLAQYDYKFMLGWCDVETESNLELNYNLSGTISEVSK